MDLQNKLFLVKDADLETKQNSILLNKDQAHFPEIPFSFQRIISDKRNITYAKIPLQKSIA